MIGRKCDFIATTFRGQDFCNRYCRYCPEEKQIKVIGSVVTCPHIHYYESYKPKRNKYSTSSPGTLAPLPMLAADVLELKKSAKDAQ